MEELIARLREWQANSFVLSTTAQGFHWNVEGALFTQYHRFFGKIYTDVYSTIDVIAEWQRKFESPAPFTLQQITELNTYGTVSSETNSPLILSQILLNMIDKMTEDVNNLFDVATAERQQGLANFCADRQDKLQFWSWWLRSSLKSTIS
jgi:DNA-binding ferritin-like protein